MKAWKLAKRMLGYLLGTADKGLEFTRSDRREFKITAFSDADFANCSKTRRSLSGFVLFLNGSPISWGAKKPGLTARSSFESEFIELASCVERVLWLVEMLKFLKLPFMKPLVYCDNQAVLKAFNNSKM